MRAFISLPCSTSIAKKYNASNDIQLPISRIGSESDTKFSGCLAISCHAVIDGGIWERSSVPEVFRLQLEAMQSPNRQYSIEDKRLGMSSLQYELLPKCCVEEYRKYFGTSAPKIIEMNDLLSRNGGGIRLG
jgi:hypothetical protein